MASHNPHREWPSYVAAGPFMFFSGQMGRTGDSGSLLMRYGELPTGRERANTAFDWVADMEAPVGAQALSIYERYRTLLATEGSELGHILRYHIYQRDKHFFSVFDRMRRSYEPRPPASTAVGLGRFDPDDRATLCIDAIALRRSGEETLGARTVLPSAAQQTAAATFSHVIGAGDFLFLAGQIPIDASRPGSPLIRNYDDIPEAGRFLRVGRSHEDARNGPIAAQTWFTYDLIRRHLEANGASMDHILNLIVYLQDMRDFPVFHRVHERFCGSSAPALTVVEAAEVGHKGTLIEIEPTAIAGPSAGRIVNAAPPDWQAPALMSACVSAGGLAFFSGVEGTAGDTTLATGSTIGGDDAEARYAAQAESAVSELGRRFAAAGHPLARAVHLTVYLRDITRFPIVERVLRTALGKWRPALTVLEMPAVAPVRGACLSITAIAWFGPEKLEAGYGVG